MNDRDLFPEERKDPLLPPILSIDILFLEDLDKVSRSTWMGIDVEAWEEGRSESMAMTTRGCAMERRHAAPPSFTLGSVGKAHLRPSGTRKAKQARSEVVRARAVEEGRGSVRASQDNPALAPMLYPDGPQGNAVDIPTYLVENRIVFIGGKIDDTVAAKVVASILALQSLDPEKDIKIYLNSPAGQFYHVMAILDLMSMCPCDIVTVGFGAVMGASSLILMSGTKGKRYAMKNSRVVLQKPQAGLQGSADECNIQAKEANRNMQVAWKIMTKCTGLDLEAVQEEMDRDNFLSPEEAVKMGVVDAVIE